jgi:glucosamine--fructose-6-phosphate aminotransferase (isomerizing)
MHAGPEIGVAATKSFTSQLTVVTLLALLLGRIHYLSYAEGLDTISELEKLPDKVAMALELDSQVAAIAKKYAAPRISRLGRQANYPIALEGALKLKEISYIAAPDIRAPSSLRRLPRNEETPSLFIAPRDAVSRRISATLRRSSGKGPVIAIGTEGDKRSPKLLMTSFSSQF